MSFVSYAQNYEDVMLWRALKHIEKGFYIDVGAWLPDKDSVTKAFYERGWCGINLEPNPECHALLKEKRSRDINLCTAVSDTTGTAELNILKNSGLTTLDDAIAEQHIAAGWKSKREEVEVVTLESIWADFAPEYGNVHFLKIDVEGVEEAVLRGNDWSKCRPWIAVIEATRPMSQVENHESWEPMLLGADYIFAYADGLNRFYVAREHSDLLTNLRYPPNIFDEFVTYPHHHSEERARSAETRAEEADTQVQKAEARAEQSETRAEEADTQVQKAEARAEQYQAELAAVYASKSWRITRPLRMMGRLTRSVLSLARKAVMKAKSAVNKSAAGLKTIAKALLRPILLKAMRFALERPGLKGKLNMLLMRHPRLRQRLIVLGRNAGLISGGAVPFAVGAQYGHVLEDAEREGIDPALEQLSESARRVYWELSEAVENRTRHS